MLYAPFFCLFHGIFGGCVHGFPLWSCSVCTGCPFASIFKLFFTGSVGAPALRMALHCFLVSFSMHCGLLPTYISVFISLQCLIFVFSSVSLSIPSINFAFIPSCRFCFACFFFVITGICILALSSAASSFTCFLHSLCPVLMMYFVRVSVCMLSMRFTCTICYFIIVYFMRMFLVSTSSIIVGVPYGR